MGKIDLILLRNSLKTCLEIRGDYNAKREPQGGPNYGTNFNYLEGYYD
jgi:hypothetical protein